jgi:hypothetical protein
MDPMYELKISQSFFPVVNTLLAARAAADFKTPGFEHWLQAYSEAELKEVLDA